MALPSSGSISTDQIRTELGLAAGTAIIIPDTVRVLAGKPTGSITLPNDLWGKSNIDPVVISGILQPEYAEGVGYIDLFIDGTIKSGEDFYNEYIGSFKTTTTPFNNIYEAKIVCQPALRADNFISDTWYSITSPRLRFQLTTSDYGDGVLWVREKAKPTNIANRGFRMSYYG